MASGELGKIYKDGEEIICEGEEGNCMFGFTKIKLETSLVERIRRFADIAGYIGGYRERARVPYGESIP